MTLQTRSVDYVSLKSEANLMKLMTSSFPYTRYTQIANGRYCVLLASILKQVNERLTCVDRTAFTVDAYGFDRRFLSVLIPKLHSQILVIDIDGFKIQIQLSFSDDELNIKCEDSQNSISIEEDFSTRLRSFIESSSLKFYQENQRHFKINPKVDAEVQGLHLRQFQYLCSKVARSYSKKRGSFRMCGPLSDQHLAKHFIRALDPTRSSFVVIYRPDGLVSFKRTLRALDLTGCLYPYQHGLNLASDLSDKKRSSIIEEILSMRIFTH